MPGSAAAGLTFTPPLIFERGAKGRTGASLPAPEVPQVDPAALYGDLVGAVAHLCQRYRIPPDHITYHREVKATACPGNWFPPKAQRIADVKARLEA